MNDVTATLTMADPRKGWWVDVRAGEELTVTVQFNGNGLFGLLIGPKPGVWDYNRSRGTYGSLTAVMPAQDVSRTVWVQVSRYSGSCTVVASITLEGFEPPRAELGGDYHVSGSLIVDKDGVPFSLKGANIGVNVMIGGATHPSNEAVSAHTVEAIEWGWNTVRINFYISEDTSWIKTYGRQNVIRDVFAATQKYLDAGFIVILAPMDVTSGRQGDTTQELLDIESFFVEAATRFLGESRVWFNINEPGGGIDTGAEFSAYHARFYDAIRATGNQSVYIADVMTNAQDPTWSKAPKAYDPSVGPAFLVGRTNVVFGLHNYGGQQQTTASQETFNNTYNGYGRRMNEAGLCFGTFETGYRVDGKDQAGNLTDVNRNVRGFRAALQQTGSVGVLVWHGTFDMFGLKLSKKDAYNTQPFWYGGSENGLSPMGQEFWSFCHGDN